MFCDTWIRRTELMDHDVELFFASRGKSCRLTDAGYWSFYLRGFLALNTFFEAYLRLRAGWMVLSGPNTRRK